MTGKKLEACQGLNCPKRSVCARVILSDHDTSGVENLCEIAERDGRPPYSKYDHYNERSVQRIVPQALWAGSAIAARPNASIFWLGAA